MFAYNIDNMTSDRFTYGLSTRVRLFCLSSLATQVDILLLYVSCHSSGEPRGTRLCLTEWCSLHQTYKRRRRPTGPCVDVAAIKDMAGLPSEHIQVEVKTVGFSIKRIKVYI